MRALRAYTGAFDLFMFLPLAVVVLGGLVTSTLLNTRAGPTSATGASPSS